MIEKKFVALIQRLHKKTTEGSVQWERSFVEDKAFTTTMGRFSLSLRPRGDPDYPDQPDYILRIHSQDDTVIEEISNVTLRGVSEELNVNALQLLQETYTTARRQVLGVEGAVDSLLSELDKDDIPF